MIKYIIIHIPSNEFFVGIKRSPSDVLLNASCSMLSRYRATEIDNTVCRACNRCVWANFYMASYPEEFLIEEIND